MQTGAPPFLKPVKADRKEGFPTDRPMQYRQTDTNVFRSWLGDQSRRQLSACFFRTY